MEQNSTNIMSDFSAKEPSLGYLYQIKFALYYFIKSDFESDDPLLRIENMDDIDILDDINTMLFQTKYHIKSKANLTNSSTDFWKTIRVWSELIKQGNIDVHNSTFNLITTQEVPIDSILHNFKVDFKSPLNTKELNEKMQEICVTSTNKTNAPAYKAFLDLENTDKEKLISRIKIFDGALNIEEIDKNLIREFTKYLYPNLVEEFKQKLEGWWLKKSVQLLSSEISEIRLSELQNRIANIRDEYHADCLPDNFDEPLEINDTDLETEKEKLFIRQIESIAINISDNRVKLAISDFRRAFEQRSEWFRKNLTDPEDESIFDKKLIDYWYNIFQLMKSESDDKAEDELKKMGRDFYLENFAKQCPKIPFRKEQKEDYLTRGSYHMLSDKLKIGWHPNFKDLHNE